jgi:subtilisin family serine protease
MMNFNNDTPYYPAAYSLQFPNVIAVGATNPDDSRTAPFFWSATSGSNYGSHLDVVAPGNYIYGLDYLSDTSSSSYWGGTSQATPLVAGIASLILAHNPSLTPQQVRQILEDTAEDQVGNPLEDTPGYDIYMGYGRVNAFAALQSPLSVDENHYATGMTIANPVQNGNIRIFSAMAGDFAFRAIDMAGREAASGKIHLAEGSNSLPLSVARGSYIFTVEGNGYRKIFRLIKGE